MAIVTGRNPAYGSPQVNNKYSPLLDPRIIKADRAIYTGLLNNRMRMLRAAGLIGQQLELTVPNWAATINAELGHQPPLVVVSSNRAAWIKRGIAAGKTHLQSLGLNAYDNASDLRALTDDDPPRPLLGISPPLYAPQRIGANRNVYVVVNVAEYTRYKAQLAGTGITVVGWSFAKGVGARSKRNLAMVGFGATRFAAMQFCKTLRREAATAAGGAAPWDSAWIIDDNTVALSSFPGFTAVENALGANACAGWKGGTVAEPPLKNRDWARRELKAGRGGQAGALPPLAQPGDREARLVQQAALWNIRYFDDERLNFGPLFIASAEDLSIINYFKNAAIDYQFYKNIGVVKEVPDLDNGIGARKVNERRAALARWVTTAESASTGPPGGKPPPPPLLVQPAQAKEDGGVQTLSTFITERVLPEAEAVKAQAGNANTQAQAKSQGAEQLTGGPNGALGLGFVNPDAIVATFRLNGTDPQAVTMRDQP
jgi:hypothetical protein